jgi:peptidoglycan hydrolase CwlO-like protein
MDTKNFWNNWDFKSILQLAIILIGFIVTYTRLDARVESDKKENMIEINYLKERVTRLENGLEKINDKLEKIYNELKTSRKE